MLYRKIPTYIRLLRPHQLHESIIVRIYRQWLNKNFRIGHVMSHDYLLIDKEVKIVNQFIIYKFDL